MPKIINVILSGGSGTRLWPLSRQSKPKQFLPLFDDRKSLFQKTLLRNKNLVDDFLLVTNSSQFSLAMSQAEDTNISINRQIIEPIGRNTAAAIALAAWASDPQDILFATPSDQIIDTGELYTHAVQRAAVLANEGFLVTFGICPTFPETGFGYIECRGEEVLSFREKPDLETATQFLNSGDFLWNSGMFCFQAHVFLSELKKYCPNIYFTSKLAHATIINDTPSLESFSAVPSMSVDHAVMEHSDIIKVIPSAFSWSDLGSFNALIDYHTTNQSLKGVRTIGGMCKDGYAFSNKNVYVCGSLDNIVLVETADCILIMPMEESQSVKEVYEMVKASEPNLIT